MKYYTGVGSRTTPQEMMEFITRLAVKLANQGYVLRSGGADGADSAFDLGAKLGGGEYIIYRANDAKGDSNALELAKKYHKAWNKMGEYAQLLHARNCYQVLGKQLNEPSDFLICWTPDACLSHKTRSINTGGTGTAISIAEAYKVKVYNLANEEHYNLFKSNLKI